MRSLWGNRVRRLGTLGASMLLCASLVTVTTGGSVAGADPDLLGTQLAVEQVASGFTRPIAMVWRVGDPRMYVAEQGGVIRLVDTNGTTLPAPVLTVTVAPGGERGLLGFDFSNDGTYLYVFYTEPGGTIKIVEYEMGADTAVAASAAELLSIPHPLSNHNGGQLIVGDDDLLYISVGDGGGGGDPDGNGQNRNTLLGKILRIDPTPSLTLPYTIPADNPFVGEPSVREEIWMYGLRNPWRFSLDRDTGDMWIGDVGQGLYEEVDYAPAGEGGANWGWDEREGFHEFEGPQPPDGQDPLVELAHSDGYCALIGGFVYRGSAIPTLQGAYVFGDYCRSGLVGVVQSGGTVLDQRGLGIGISSLTAFGEDNDGELHLASISGAIYRLVPVTASTIAIGDATIVEGDVGAASVSVPVTLSEPSFDEVTVEWTTANGTALAPGDYTTSSGTVTFAPGDISETISVPVVGDGVSETPEKFSVKLSGALGAKVADVAAIVNVLDHDAPLSVSVADAWVFEGSAGNVDGVLTLSLSRPVPIGASASVTVDTADGSANAGMDYTEIAPTVVNFAPGEQTKPVAIPVSGDTTSEKSESVQLNVTTPVGAVLADKIGVLTIRNDDPNPSAVPTKTITIGDATTVEGDAGTASVSVPVFLSASATSAVTVNWTTADSTAKAPGDYTPSSGVVTFAPGATSATLSLPVVGDLVNETNEKITVKLSGASGAKLADSSAVVNVLDNDAPISIVINDTTSLEGSTGPNDVSFTVSLSRPVPVGATVSVKVATSSVSAATPSDYTALPLTTITFAAGEQTKSVLVSVVGDTAIENNESFRLNLSTPVGSVIADTYGLHNVINDD